MANSQTREANNPRMATGSGEASMFQLGYVPIYPGTPPVSAYIQIPQQANVQTARAKRYFRGGPPITYGYNRFDYPREDRLRALRLLGLGFTYRQVAGMLSPHTSISTISRWRRQHLHPNIDFSMNDAIARRNALLRQHRRNQ